MSSMRNAHQRRNHKERAQPTERSRLGLLEKHKDYTLRSKDHNKKKAQIKALKQKAADRNEDEFYFGMLSRAGPSTFASKGKRWTGTVDGDRGNKVMDVETVRLLKTQDMGYLRTQRTLALKEANSLEERVLGLSGTLNADADADADEEWDDDDDDDMMMDGLDGIAPPKNRTATPKPKKIGFAEGASERDGMIGLEMAKDAHDDDNDDESDDEKKDPEKLRADERQKLLEKLQRRLQNARKKLRVLSRAENQLELQRAGMAKTRTVGGIRKSGTKIKVRERKR